MTWWKKTYFNKSDFARMLKMKPIVFIKKDGSYRGNKFSPEELQKLEIIKQQIKKDLSR